jgi:hypothetical protein
MLVPIIGFNLQIPETFSEWPMRCARNIFYFYIYFFPWAVFRLFGPILVVGRPSDNTLTICVFPLGMQLSGNFCTSTGQAASDSTVLEIISQIMPRHVIILWNVYILKNVLIFFYWAKYFSPSGCEPSISDFLNAKCVCLKMKLAVSIAYFS